jgi:Lamin Tail Domain/Bacterial Ig-like domain
MTLTCRIALFFCAVFALLSAPATAQLTESFTDGNFTQSPVWQGDATDFIVNPSQQLQTNGASVAGVKTLTTPSRVSGAATWEFWANLKFGTSSANLADVFLLSDSARLTGQNCGYFVRLGGMPDEVSLFRKDATGTTLLVDGTDGLLASTSNNVIRVQVTRDAAGNWSLGADATGGTAFAPQGTARDTVYHTARYFGVVARYTASNSQKFYFDDFSITDASPPTITGLTVSSVTTLRLQLDEPLAVASGTTASNYAVSGLGAATSATLDPLDEAAVLLTFGSPFSAGLNTVTVSFMEDLYGNGTSAAITRVFIYTPPAQPGDVRITELFVDPSPAVGLPAAPFVEVLNTSGQPLNLLGWRLQDAAGATAGSAGTLLAGRLAPGQYAILTATADTATYRTLLGPATRIIGVTSMPTLNQSGDLVRLLAPLPAPTVLDELTYNTTWYHDPVKGDGGWSLEKINPTKPCSDGDNWLASTDASGGTPGRQNAVHNIAADLTSPALVSATLRNATTVELVFSEAIDTLTATVPRFSLTGGLSVTDINFRPDSLRFVTLTLNNALTPGTFYSLTIRNVADCAGNAPTSPLTAPLLIGATAATGEVRITELFVDTTIPAGNPLTTLPAAPFVEVLNISTKYFDLTGWKLQDATTSAGTLGAGLLAPGHYAVLARTTDTTTYRAFLCPTIRLVGITSMPTLNLTGDVVKLLTPAGLLLDQVTYTDDWYRDPVKDDGGWSLEKINPIKPCSDADNWLASTDVSGGTPGRQNAVHSTAADLTPPALVSATLRNATTVELVLSEAIDTLTAVPSRFTIMGGLTVIAVDFRADSLRYLTLTLNSPLLAGTRYTLTGTGVADCAGNTAPFSTTLGLGAFPEKYELLLTEIYADETPSVGLPASEYVEIFNPTNRLLDLSGVTLRKQGSASTAFFPAGATLAPGQYAVVCGSTRGGLFAPFGQVFALTSFPSLNNAGDTLVLRRADGQFLFSVAYSDQWYRDPTKKDGGWSLEMIDPAQPCGLADNWKASENPVFGGSPGTANSVNAALSTLPAPALAGAFAESPNQIRMSFTQKLDSLTATDPARYTISGGLGIGSATVRGPEMRTVLLTLNGNLTPGEIIALTVNGLTGCGGATQVLTTSLLIPEAPRTGDVVINEILFNPRPGGVDFVEVTNRSERQLDLNGYFLANMRGDSLYQMRRLAPNGFALPPGALAVLTMAPDSVVRQYPTSSDRSRMLTVPSMPTFSDDKGTVVLLAPDSTELDRYTYDERQHTPLLTNEEGVSLERIRLDGPSVASNFHSAAGTAGFATPGKTNSQTRSALELPDHTLSIEPRVITPGRGGAEFADIAYSVPVAGYTANFTIFDSQGRLTRRLVRNQTLGTSGTFQWQGEDDNNRRVPTGYYVLYAEFFDLQGSVKVVKQTVAVGSR